MPKADLSSHAFTAFVGEESLEIPYRVYHDVTLIQSAQLVGVQLELLDCLLTRHHDGRVREEHLRKILRSNGPWVPPFVVHLAGEYVIEILYAIRDGLAGLDPRLYRMFLTQNPAFFERTKQRVESYRNCYYPSLDKGTYPGSEIVRFFDALVASGR